MKKILPYAVLCVIIPFVVVGGAVVFSGRPYAGLSLAVAEGWFVATADSF